MLRIAYFGPQGTFTEQAAREMAPQDEFVAADSVSAALTTVRDGVADAACVPVENSVEGAVAATLDSLAAGDPLVAVAESLLPIRFSVLTREPDTEIRTVASHPHALAQVREWLATNLPEARAVAASSTAAAAVAVHDGEYDAAVAAPIAARHYPLHVVATDVADVADARTRFLLVRQPGSLPDPTGADRTSIVAVTTNRTGALAGLLDELASRGVNLTRLDARPRQDTFGEYRFFIDVEGHIAEPRVGEAMMALQRRCDLRFLGSHGRADGVRPTVGAGADNDDFAAAATWLAQVRAGKLA